ncbi:MAG TPA: hypothetical protein VLE19_09330 [Pyrinomonadaceae bacterium]|nr:hypothetical protein [Pyrinomonadaceae bacterium]
MPKSARLSPVIAVLLIWLMPCSQVAVVTASAFNEANLSSLDRSANSKVSVKKSKKKRRKKKTTISVPYLGVMLPSVTEDARRTISTVVRPTAESLSEMAPQLRPTTRATRTPGLHIAPVGRQPLGVPAVSVSNSSPITIFDTNPTTDPNPAEPYSSDIDVAGLVGNVTSVSVTINGLTHSNPDDLDMLLVSPDDRAFHFWSDVGGGSLNPQPSPVTITVADSGSQPLPDEGPLVTDTTYRPFNSDTNGDDFPVPAPGPPYEEPSPVGKATFASVFNGMSADQANGTWRLFITDDQNSIGGSISGGWTLNINTQVPVTSAGQLVISEFRTSGPSGPSDEFVELYNTTGAPLIVQSVDDSAGLGVFASDGILRCVVPNNTVIPINGHYLCANGVSVGAPGMRRPAQASFAPDQFINLDIPTNAGIALFNTAATGPEFQVLANRIDAVGPTTADPLYKEGTGYNELDQPTLDHAFYRDLRPNGQPKDTGNNADDFLFVDTSGAATSSGQRLGAPSPEGLADPRTSPNVVSVDLLAPCMAATDSPNRVRSFTSDPANNATFGTMSIRRAVTNVTVNEITALRFKVIAITSFPAPQGVADLRLRSTRGGEESDPCSPGNTFTLMGLALDGPSQPMGGAFNSNVSADILSLGQPLQPGQTIYVEFLLGVQQTGRFHFFVNIEALP